jgi:hypothetical protein
MLRTTIEGERFLHKELWRVVERQFEHAAAHPTGSLYDYLVAMVFAFHTLEAYLNFVGERLAPELWQDERNFFRNEPYRGFDGKLRKVLELVELPEPDRESRPYSTVWLLKGLRDLIVHARPERFRSVIEHTADDQPSLHHTPLDGLVTVENAARAREDVAQFIETIHAHAKPKLAHDLWFGAQAFHGPLQYSSGHTTKAS